MKFIVSLLPIILLMASPLQAELRLPAVISDHAMLQADKPIAIWGWSEPGAQVKVIFGNSEAGSTANFATTADVNGKWSGQLPTLKSGTTGELQLSSDKDNPIKVTDLLVGEVWLGGGQSNMVYSIEGKFGFDPNSPEEAAQVKENIGIAQKEASELQQPVRYFEVAFNPADTPGEDVQGHWVQADVQNVQTFSAVAWNFAVALQSKLQVPIGLIVTCKGGTPAQAWMSRETLEATSVGAAVEARDKESLADLTPEKMAKYKADLQAWEEVNPTPEAQSKNMGSRPKRLYSIIDRPNVLYNGMLHGLIPYGLRGFIWFQADANIAHPLEYSELFQALIKEWRAEWKEQLPFYFVEMNNMNSALQTTPVAPSNLAILREQQHGGLLQPGVGMVAAIDLGINKNPHFPNKKPVGQRLAGLALRDVYHLDVGQVDSPMYKSFVVEGNRIRLTFTHAEGLRVRGGGELQGFAIRAAKGDWVWATGKIDGQDILVWNDQVPAPVAVRYAWAAFPIISMENGAGLPMFPFRTDTGSEQ